MASCADRPPFLRRAGYDVAAKDPRFGSLQSLQPELDSRQIKRDGMRLGRGNRGSAELCGGSWSCQGTKASHWWGSE